MGVRVSGRGLVVRCWLMTDSRGRGWVVVKGEDQFMRCSEEWLVASHLMDINDRGFNTVDKGLGSWINLGWNSVSVYVSGLQKHNEHFLLTH